MNSAEPNQVRRQPIEVSTVLILISGLSIIIGVGVTGPA
jgi:hypothetical protein